MKNSFPFILIVCSILYFQSCKEKEKVFVEIDNGIELEEDAVNAFKAIDTSPKNQDVSLKISENETWTFRLTTPTVNDDTPKPLVMALHWAGGENAFASYAACLAQSGLDSLNGFIISPSANSKDWKTDNNEKKILSLISLAKRNWNIDPEKIVLTGYSNGGIATWYYVEKYADLFSCAIPMASVNRGGTVHKFDIPLYVIHGEKDELFPLDTTKAYVDAIIEKGSDVVFVQADGLTHYDGCSYDSYLQQTVKWVFDVWDK